MQSVNRDLGLMPKLIHEALIFLQVSHLIYSPTLIGSTLLGADRHVMIHHVFPFPNVDSLMLLVTLLPQQELQRAWDVYLSKFPSLTLEHRSPCVQNTIRGIF